MWTPYAARRCRSSRCSAAQQFIPVFIGAQTRPAIQHSLTRSSSLGKFRRSSVGRTAKPRFYEVLGSVSSSGTINCQDFPAAESGPMSSNEHMVGKERECVRPQPDVCLRRLPLMSSSGRGGIGGVRCDVGGCRLPQWRTPCRQQPVLLRVPTHGPSGNAHGGQVLQLNPFSFLRLRG